MDKSQAGKLGNLKSQEALCKLRQERIDKYNETPSKCLDCDAVLSYEKRKNKFCNRSCAAKTNNLGVIRNKEKEKNNCVVCNQLTKNIKFCSHSCRCLNKKEEVSGVVNDGKKDNSVSARAIKKHLINLHGNKCQECGWCDVNPYSGNIPIELEHIDGNSDNNDISNLKLLCPNCHSLTATYKILNRGNGRHKRRERYKTDKSF